MDGCRLYAAVVGYIPGTGVRFGIRHFPIHFHIGDVWLPFTYANASRVT